MPPLLVLLVTLVLMMLLASSSVVAAALERFQPGDVIEVTVASIRGYVIQWGADGRQLPGVNHLRTSEFSRGTSDGLVIVGGPYLDDDGNLMYQVIVPQNDFVWIHYWYAEFPDQPRFKRTGTRRGLCSTFTGCTAPAHLPVSYIAAACASETCTTAECCRAPQPNTCSSYTCSNPDDVAANTLLAWSLRTPCDTCTDNDCCGAAPSCSDWECASHHHVKRDDAAQVRCSGPYCTDRECCRRRCDAYVCDATTSTSLATNVQFHKVCGGFECTHDECCDGNPQPTTCVTSSFTCSSGWTRKTTAADIKCGGAAPALSCSLSTCCDKDKIPPPTPTPVVIQRCSTHKHKCGSSLGSSAADGWTYAGADDRECAADGSACTDVECCVRVSVCSHYTQCTTARQLQPKPAATAAVTTCLADGARVSWAKVSLPDDCNDARCCDRLVNIVTCAVYSCVDTTLLRRASPAKTPCPPGGVSACTDALCCVPRGTCSELTSCPSGHRRDPSRPDSYTCRGRVCLADECCLQICEAYTATSPCAAGTHVVDDAANVLCGVRGGCVASDCCVPNDTCAQFDASDCPADTILARDQVCASSNQCSADDDCCAVVNPETPTCGPFTCGVGHRKRVATLLDPNLACGVAGAATQCTDDTCCVLLPVCTRAFVCPSVRPQNKLVAAAARAAAGDTSTTTSDGRPRAPVPDVCAGDTCTGDECCELADVDDVTTCREDDVGEVHHCFAYKRGDIVAIDAAVIDVVFYARATTTAHVVTGGKDPSSARVTIVDTHVSEDDGSVWYHVVVTPHVLAWTQMSATGGSVGAVVEGVTVVGRAASCPEHGGFPVTFVDVTAVMLCPSDDTSRSRQCNAGGGDISVDAANGDTLDVSPVTGVWGESTHTGDGSVSLCPQYQPIDGTDTGGKTGDDGGLSVIAVIGIIIGALAFCAVALYLIIVARRRYGSDGVAMQSVKRMYARASAKFGSGGGDDSNDLTQTLNTGTLRGVGSSVISTGSNSSRGHSRHGSRHHSRNASLASNNSDIPPPPALHLRQLSRVSNRSAASSGSHSRHTSGYDSETTDGTNSEIDFFEGDDGLPAAAQKKSKGFFGIGSGKHAVNRKAGHKKNKRSKANGKRVSLMSSQSKGSNKRESDLHFMSNPMAGLGASAAVDADNDDPGDDDGHDRAPSPWQSGSGGAWAPPVPQRTDARGNFVKGVGTAGGGGHKSRNASVMSTASSNVRPSRFSGIISKFGKRVSGFRLGGLIGGNADVNGEANMMKSDTESDDDEVDPRSLKEYQAPVLVNASCINIRPEESMVEDYLGVLHAAPQPTNAHHARAPSNDSDAVDKFDYEAAPVPLNAVDKRSAFDIAKKEDAGKKDTRIKNVRERFEKEMARKAAEAAAAASTPSTKKPGVLQSEPMFQEFD